MSIARGKWDKDTLTSFAGRLARLDRKIDEKQRETIRDKADGKSLKKLIIPFTQFLFS
jgi:type I restriction enzyme R subunit